MRRTAMITGASRGLGAELASFLAEQGYDLLLTARRAKPLELKARSLQEYGGRVIALAGDVADPEHAGRLLAAARSLGRLDLLVNNASDLGSTPLPSLAEYPLDSVEHVLNVNLVAPLRLIQSMLPRLRVNRGLIVNISSDAALGGYPGWGIYGASKAALDLLSLTLAEELRAVHVAVVSVDPGDMRTEMHQAAFPGEDISDRPLPEVTRPFWAWLLGQSPMSVTGRRYQAQADRWEVAA
ncbi:MAG: SDR family oxidoreductase [Chloroflexi bacterium]|nr:SDR family oxidoreductase [Chloroflexota bacterium]